MAVPVTFAHTFLAPAWLLGVGASLCSGPLLLQCKRGCGCSRSAYCSSRSGGLCLTSHRPTHLSPLHCLRCYLPLAWHRAIRWADSSEPWGGVGWGWGVGVEGAGNSRRTLRSIGRSSGVKTVLARVSHATLAAQTARRHKAAGESIKRGACLVSDGRCFRSAV